MPSPVSATADPPSPTRFAMLASVEGILDRAYLFMCTRIGTLYVFARERSDRGNPGFKKRWTASKQSSSQ